MVQCTLYSRKRNPWIYIKSLTGVRISQIQKLANSSDVVRDKWDLLERSLHDRIRCLKELKQDSKAYGVRMRQLRLQEESYITISYDST